ncbi:glucokinase [Desulfitobacterium metallireducens DSM 15288]|uniref:Glucokinase n=2 Tax=Desulfitobacterium TaxID=36853 RepID=W0EC82_9FIRM|nr:glucokinase [Desulfitobacterium metallireducens DSM 15288]
MILAGDIGGTNTRLGIFEQSGSELCLVRQKKQASTGWQDLVPVIYDFLKNAGVSPEEIESGCLSFAGPIQDNHCQLTNLGKTIDLERVQKSINIETRLSFCNDLVALGYGLLSLKPSQLDCLTTKKSACSYTHLPSFNRAILAPGTGLGESLIIEEQYVMPTEGAHGDFAPRSELEVRLWRFLHLEFGHVSNERILSGPGLTRLYRFFLNEAGKDDQTSSLLSPEVITQKAIAKSCPVCEHALNLFLEILGAEAGNLALRSLAFGGIYLGGGIVPKLLPQLHEGRFLNAFYDKGRFCELLESIPVYVILDEKTALYGAARYAILQRD